MVTAISSARHASRVLKPAYVMSIKALAEPQTLPRIAGLFAQFGTIPAVMSSQRHDHILTIDVQFDAESVCSVDLLLAKIRAMVVVQRARLISQ